MLDLRTNTFCRISEYKKKDIICHPPLIILEFDSNLRLYYGKDWTVTRVYRVIRDSIQNVLKSYKDSQDTFIVFPVRAGDVVRIYTVRIRMSNNNIYPVLLSSVIIPLKQTTYPDYDFYVMTQCGIDGREFIVSKHTTSQLEQIESLNMRFENLMTSKNQFV